MEFPSIDELDFSPTGEILFYSSPTNEGADLSYQSTIIYTSTNRYFQVATAFHYQSNQIFIKIDQQYYLLFPEKIAYIQKADKVLVYSDYQKGKEIHQGYLQLLVNGTVVLLLHENIEDKKIQKEYFIKENDDAAKPIVLSKKSLLEITAKKEAFLKNYLKDSQLNPKQESDFRQLLTYYNSLNN